MTHLQVVGAVQHTTVSITSAINHISVTFCCCHIHTRSVKFFCNQCFRSFRSKVSKKNNQGIALSFVYIFQCLFHIFFVFNSYRTFIKFSFVSVLDCCTSLLRKLDWKTVTTYCDHSKFYYRNIIHDNYLHL